MSVIVDKGSAILIEVDFKVRSPQSSIGFFDPASATLTVTDPTSTVVVSSQVMSKTDVNSTGLYHAIVQTSTEWAIGRYTTDIRALDGSFNEVNIEPRIFELE